MSVQMPISFDEPHDLSPLLVLDVFVE